MKDILGNSFISEDIPPNNGICPYCGGNIVTDVVVSWRCEECDSEFDNNN